MSQRIRENLSGYNEPSHNYVRTKTEQTGEYIDQFTTVEVNRTNIDEVLSRLPKCLQKPKKVKNDDENHNLPANSRTA